MKNRWTNDYRVRLVMCRPDCDNIRRRCSVFGSLHLHLGLLTPTGVSTAVRCSYCISSGSIRIHHAMAEKLPGFFISRFLVDPWSNCGGCFYNCMSIVYWNLSGYPDLPIFSLQVSSSTWWPWDVLPHVNHPCVSGSDFFSVGWVWNYSVTGNWTKGTRRLSIFHAYVMHSTSSRKLPKLGHTEVWHQHQVLATLFVRYS